MKTCKLLLLLCMIPFAAMTQIDTARRILTDRRYQQNPVVGDEKGPVKPLSSYTTPQTAFDNFNVYAVTNNPTVATSFTLSSSRLLVSIQTYHWNNGRGALPGTIKLLHANGTVYGPWQATGSPVSGNVKNVYWTVTPNIAIPSGIYTIVVSDKASWSRNSQSQNKGFAKVMVKM